MPTRLYSDVQMLDHQPGDGHPERPARLAALLHGLRERPVPGATWHAAREATETELGRAHGQAPTPAELRRARRALNRAALHGLDLALRERLDWRGTEAEEDRLLFVYERLGEEGLMERLGALADAPKLGEGPDLRARFAAWVAEQPEAQRFRRLAAVQGPVEAEAWLAPG